VIYNVKTKNMRNKVQRYFKLFLLIVGIGVVNSLNAQIIEGNSIKCFGDSTGRIGVYPNTGLAPFTYLWSNGATTQIIDGLKTGIYAVTVTDDTAATWVYSYTLSEPQKITTNFILTNNNSWPVNSGSIQINAAGGSGWFTYSITDSVTNLITSHPNSLFTNLASGAYYVTTSDLYGCMQLDTVHVGENSNLPVVMTIDTTACYMSTASASAQPSIAGTVPIVINFDNVQLYTIVQIIAGPRPYVMSNGIDTLSSISYAAEPGFHIVTVSDANNNGYQYSWVVDSVTTPISISWTQQNITVNGANTGSIVALAQGSYNTFTYTITGPFGFSVNSNAANSLLAGTYVVTAVDYTSCSLSQSVIITQPEITPIVEENSVKCFGDSTGRIGVYPNTGLAPFTYLWSTGATTQIIDGLKAGFYSVTVTDATAATWVFSYTLTEPQKITAVYTITSNGSWPVNTGNILVTVSGGSSWFNYSIVDSLTNVTTSQPTPLFSNLASGAYYVTITDLYSCMRIDTVHVGENANLPVVMTIDTTACYNSTASTTAAPSITGVVPIVVNFDNIQYDTIVEIIAGVRPYVMSTIGDTLSSISYAAEPGFHLITVYDANNNGFRYSWVVDSVVTPISITWTQHNNLCYGGNLGSITSLAQGSWNGFTYTITGPSGFSANSSSAGSLFAGEYVIQATDYTGCLSSQTVVITQPDEPLRVNFDILKNPRCPYSADGEITIRDVEGAEGALTYLWSMGETTQGLDSLLPGNYIVTITDANSCTTNDSLLLKADKGSCIYNVITPNGDGYNDYLDLSDLCKGKTMQAEIFNEAGKSIATLTEANPRWDGEDSSNPPTGMGSTYTLFIKVSVGGQPYMNWSESISVIYSK
jgi:gliding motility-associated-like protein